MSDFFEFHRDRAIRAQQDEVRRRVFELVVETPHLDWLILTKRPENALLYTAELQQVLAEGGHVWLLVSAEDQKRAEERLPVLLELPALVRGVSAEPLLGPVDLGLWLARLDWVIAGAESGPGARPAELGWFRSLRDQCTAAAVPFFLKQAAICPRCHGSGVRSMRRGQRAAVCSLCGGTGQSGSIRKRCPRLDERCWAELPHTFKAQVAEVLG